MQASISVLAHGHSTRVNAITATVMVVVELAPVDVIEDGEKVQVAPAASPEHVKLTVPLKPSSALSVMMSLALEPRGTLSAEDAATIWKSVLVSAKVALVAPADAVAVMLYDPAVLLAVAVTVAMPEELVVAVAAESVALAPLAGAEYVTVAPETGLPLWSTTSVDNAAVKAVPTNVLWLAPPCAERLVAEHPLPRLSSVDCAPTCPLASCAAATRTMLPVPATGNVNGRPVSGIDE